MVLGHLGGQYGWSKVSRGEQTTQPEITGADYRVRGGGVVFYSAGGGKLGFEKKSNNIILHALLYQMCIPMRGKESYPHLQTRKLRLREFK